MRKTVLAGAAAAMIALGSAQAARFEPTYGDGGYGVSVSVTDDGCTASVLFDSASVSDAQDWYVAQVPLMIAGRSTVVSTHRSSTASRCVVFPQFSHRDPTEYATNATTISARFRRTAWVYAARAPIAAFRFTNVSRNANPTAKRNCGMIVSA